MLDPAPEPPSVPLVEPARRILPVERLGAAIEVVLCSGFPTQLMLMGVLTGFGMPMQTSDGHLSPPFVVAVSMADAVLVIGLVLVFLRIHRESVSDVLFGRRSILKEALVGIAMVPAIFMLVVAVLALILMFAPDLHNVPKNPLEAMLQTRRDAIVFAVVVLVAGGVREEVQRGFILHRFGQFLGGGAVGLLVFSAVFGLGHIDQGIDAAVATALLGVVWGALYLVRRSIVAPMVSHACFNLAQLLKFVALNP